MQDTVNLIQITTGNAIKNKNYGPRLEKTFLLQKLCEGTEKQRSQRPLLVSAPNPVPQFSGADL